MTQQDALNVLKTGENVFLTGSAGSGKTYVLNRYTDYLKLQGKHIGITASTGVASTHLNGMTINAWAGIGLKQTINDSEIATLLKRSYLRKRLSKIDVLLIDEVSMLAPGTFAVVDKVLQAFKDNESPFGGIQVILCGDFFQLPPVEKTNEEKTQLYRSQLWEELDLKVCYLETPYRQDDKEFLKILDKIRHNDITKDMWETLKHRFFQTFKNGVSPTRLYTHNAHADAVNNQMLAKLPENPHLFHMQKSGNPELSSLLQRSCLSPATLVLKKDALVMFVKNNFDAGYVNGSMGRVIDFTDKDGYPVVKMFNHKELIVRPATWSIEEDDTVEAKIQQIPLRLAWGITIHKSQGMSLDAAEIDLGKSFVRGLGYVALSRVRTLNGIRLRSLNRTALSVSEDVIELDIKLQRLSNQIVLELQNSPYYSPGK